MAGFSQTALTLIRKHSNEALSSQPPLWQNISSFLNIIFSFLNVAGLEDYICTQLSKGWSKQMIKHWICKK